MRLGAIGFAYRRLRGRYPLAFLIVELQSALFIVMGALALFSFYWEGSAAEYLTLGLLALAYTEISVIWVIRRTAPRLRPVRHWIDGARDEESTSEAWAAAVSMPIELVKRELPGPVLFSVGATCVTAVLILDLSWLSFIPLAAASLIGVGYAAMLHYLAVEVGMRPVLLDINSQLSPRTSTNLRTVPLRYRLMVALPLINLITGLVVAALTSDGSGGADLGVDVMVALAVATTVSLELTVMLSK